MYETMPTSLKTTFDAFTAIELTIEIVTDPGNEERAESLLAVAERNCISSQSLTAPVHVSGTVIATPDRAVG